MVKCCVSSSIVKNQRRINGWQLPLSLQQIVSWMVFIVTLLINLTIICQIQPYILKVISLILFVSLYVTHVAYHITAVTIDPAEDDLRNRETSEVPEFDRNIHAHVIEDGRCHLCNIYTSNKKTKHCGLCNKCVYGFDHHCKWLNNCIGERNYFAFIGCVITALSISTLTSALCITDVVLFLKQPELLSSDAQHFLNCSSIDTTNNVKYCHRSISFLTFIVILCVCGLAITCTLLHLYCFHFYIALLGQSTYEYIVRKRNTETSSIKCYRKMYSQNSIKGKQETSENLRKSNTQESRVGESANNRNDANVTNLLNIVINSELNKAMKMFTVFENKVHPQQDTELSNA